MDDRLKEILDVKRREVVALRAAGRASPPRRPAGDRRDFHAAIAQRGIRLIAEIKRRSPSRGTIRETLDVEATAASFERHGATAISVLTDRSFFGGSLDDLAAARRGSRLPLLRKDFLLDEIQLEESRAAGADAVLLIVAALGRRLGAMMERCRRLDLDALVEVHTEADVRVALDEGARFIGVNNRDLKSFRVDRTNAYRLRSLIPASCVVVAESGIRSRDEVLALEEAGFAGCLVGESLMRAGDPGIAMDALLGRQQVGGPR